MERITVPKLIAAGIYEAKVETGEERITKKRKTAMFELELPLRAGGVSYIDGIAQPIERGCLFLAKPGQMRQTRLPFTCAFVHIIVKDEYLYSLLSALPTFIKTERYDYFYELFERINAYYSTGLMSDEVMIVSLLLELIYAIFLTGIGSAILFRNKASSGGTDIAALILKKYTSLNVSQSLLVTDFLIATSTFFVYEDVTVGLYAMLGLFAKVFVVDDILDSMNMCKAFTIITTKPEEIDSFILNEMKHSATTYKAEGVYSHESKQIIITVCKRSEAHRLRKKVKEIDPGSFIIITKTSEIMGKGFQT